MKRLTLCADDFAASQAISEGIARLAALGRISATSAMVLSPRWAVDAALLQGVRGRMDVGLHLDWTSAFARAAGHGLSLKGAMLRAVLGGFDPQAARTVIVRQLDAFEAVWQGPPDHIDGHQHVQQFDGIRQALVAEVAQRYAPSDRPYLRLSTPASLDKSLKAAIISGLGAAPLAALAGRAGMACAPALSGIYDFTGGAARYADLMDRWLREAPAGAVLMCHPAAQASADDELGPARAWEYGYLASDAFPQALECAAVTLTRGSKLQFDT